MLFTVKLRVNFSRPSYKARVAVGQKWSSRSRRVHSGSRRASSPSSLLVVLLARSLELRARCLAEMVQAESATRHSVIPGFLYCPASAAVGTTRSLVFDGLLLARDGGAPASLPSSSSPELPNDGSPAQFLVPAPKEKIELYSPQFYAACTAGGIASCGLTHMAVTPLDLVKCNMQVNAADSGAWLVPTWLTQNALWLVA